MAFTKYRAVWRIRDEGEPEIQQRVFVLCAPRESGYVDVWYDGRGARLKSCPVHISELIAAE